MEPEVRGLVEAMTVETTGRSAGFDFWQGSLEGIDCVIARCGMGKVSAAAGLQRLIDQFAITQLIVCGLAGGLQRNLGVGDVVVGERFVQYDLDASPIYPRFEVPGLGRDAFVADSDLVKQAIAAAGRIAGSPTVYQGLIVTGDQFVKDDRRQELLSDFPDALCVEMEGAAIAQVCYLNALPFVIIRVISDRADGSAPTDFKRFVTEVAPTYTVGIVLELLRSLPH
jgi:adenosylhomocysteine nucleosidase